MTAQALSPASRVPRYGQVEEVLRHASSAAITAGTGKWKWIVPCYSRIADIIVHSATAGSGGTSDIIDVNLNGTTIFTTQGNRPTLLVGDTGQWTVSGLGATNSLASADGTLVLVPGDYITYDIDQVCTTGSALVDIAIILVKR